VPFDPNKPATGGPLSSAEIRENFRALKEDRIVDAGYLEGLTASAFVTRTTPVIITAVHTFNPSTAGAPFALGANAQGQLVTGLNADMVDGQHASAFASASHNHDTTYVRKSTADTITAVHIFNPSTASAPFSLGANAQGQKVTGLNADMLDGKHDTDFASATHNHDTTYVRKSTADTITAVHTFNPSTTGAPFALGANAQGQKVTGLNADMLDGKHDTDFASATHNHDSSYAPINHNHDTTYVRKSTADTITAVHTFNPSSPGAPFILGANAQGQKVTGLNADMVDGQDASAFASASHNHDTTYVRKSTADTITAVHTFNPSSAGAPFALGANAQGQKVTGLNADMLDGKHDTDFASATHNHDSSYAPINHNHDTTYVRKSTADTITAVHTFNPSSAGAPFALGANAQGQKVTGLNADMLDGKHDTDFASASHNHDTTYVRKSTADTITAVHTFNPSSAGAPFILGANAQGRKVTGLNADMLDGKHDTDFASATHNHDSSYAPINHNHDTTYVRKSTADTITAVHTFNPSSAGAPFILGANAQGRKVTGLNADMLDGKHDTDFASASHNHDTTYVRKSTADTITAVHTFNPSSPGAPFILGANAQGQKVTGLNADMVDGQDASAFASASHNHDTTYVRKSTADTITAVHTFNPSTTGAPFTLGANAQGQLVTGLNADMVDGQHASAFVRKSTADTITAVHTFNPSSAGAPFILGANAQGKLITGLNADMVDGYHYTDFPRRYTSNITVTVGSGGDFSTINQALDYIVNTYAPYARSNGESLSVEIKLKSGFVMREQVFVRGHDLSWITITAEDDEVIVDGNYITRSYQSTIIYPVFCADNGGILPIISCLFSMINVNGRRGIFVNTGAKCYINKNCGFKNAYVNLLMSSGATVIAEEAYLSDAQYIGIEVSDGYLFANEVNCSNCGDIGIKIFYSVANICYAEVLNCGTYGVYCNGSIVNAYGSNVSGGHYGIYVTDGSIVNAYFLNASGSQYGIYVTGGSIVSNYNSTASTNVTPNTITSKGLLIR